MAVKDLFALPYVVDRPIAVAVHNMGGTLIIDADPGDRRVSTLKDQRHQQQHPFEASSKSSSSLRKKSSTPRPKNNNEESHAAVDIKDENDNTSNEKHNDDILTCSLVALSSLEPSVTRSQALTIVNSIIHQSSSSQVPKILPLTSGASPPLPHTKEQENEVSSIPGSDQPQRHQQQLGLPEEYAANYIPPAPEPREYLSWKFHGMNLLVGSDALIYRSTDSEAASTTTTATTALTIRVEDAGHMQAMLQQHQAMIQTGTFVADHQLAKLQQMGKPSYAEAVSAKKPIVSRATATAGRTLNSNSSNEREVIGKDCASHEGSKAVISNEAKCSTPQQLKHATTGRSFAAPDLHQVQLQTCIVPIPSESSSVGSLLTIKGTDSSVVNNEDGLTNNSKSLPLSLVSTVLDTYLDNIMANVPQLALCLREKGFIQSVKLLNTEEIPSRLMQPGTLDTSIPFETIRSKGPVDPADEVFSPQIMEMNAQALLRFLKTNCTKDNATYLLRRDAGRANIELYDISSISAQRQQKWIWWLAMISYRFSNRLRHLSLHTVADNALRRSFRVRQRSLLHNTLDLLETLADMNGNKHESLIAAVCENLADTFLMVGGDDDEGLSVAASGLQTTKAASPIVPPPQAVSSHQPYGNISVDALSKAHDHLVYGIKVLNTVLDRNLKHEKRATAKRKLRTKRSQSKKEVVNSVNPGESSASDASESGDEKSSDLDDASASDEQIDPVVTQLFGINHKLVNVSLRLSEFHLKNYWSSSAMQNLRTAAQRIADSLYLAQLIDHGLGADSQGWLSRLQLQYTWLWEQCGHFARSFAADDLWRDRGHASGDDVVSVLLDVESAFTDRQELDADGPLLLRRFMRPADSISAKSNGLISLQSLSGIVDFCRSKHKSYQKEFESRQSGIILAKRHLEDQKTLQRDERRVLVAASLAYSRAVYAFDDFLLGQSALCDKTLVDLLRQRLGDACNETGKVMLNELRNLFVSLPGQANAVDDSPVWAADALCSSAEFWFLEGLRSFEECRDLRNLALLRCNLCQCYKLRANSIFAKINVKGNDDPSHAEVCLQDAVNHLQAAHEALENRDVDPFTWDMVSGELAATFLVLGVRRRQSLIGSGNNLMILHALRLSPGKERSIVDPMERALQIYGQMGNLQQAAAAHYQLAQFYSKIWTCQRDEAKTREKLAAAFSHYDAAYGFFARAVRGNEATFCLLCLDLASLYASVSGEECLLKALLCCLDTAVTFAPDAIVIASKDFGRRQEWFQKMNTLASSVDEQTFKFLKNLVKLEDHGLTLKAAKTYKDLYRAGLSAKISFGTIPLPAPFGDEVLDATSSRLQALCHVLHAIKTQYDSIK